MWRSANPCEKFCKTPLCGVLRRSSITRRCVSLYERGDGKLCNKPLCGAQQTRSESSITSRCVALHDSTRQSRVYIESSQLKTWAPFSVHFSLPPIGARVNLLVLCGYLLDVRIMSNTQTQLDIMTWFS